MATSELKDLIAQQAALGTGTSDLAEQHSYSPSGIRALLSTDDMKERVKAAQDRLLGEGQQAMYMFLLHAKELAAAQLGEALDPSSPNSFKARTWLLEQIMPQRKGSGSQDVNVHLDIHQDVIVGLTHAAREVSAVLSMKHEGHPVILPGKAALPGLSGTTSEDEQSH